MGPHRLHAVHKMRPIAIHVALSVVCLSCSGQITELCNSEGTDRDAVWWLTGVGLRNHVLDGRHNRTNLFAAARDDKAAMRPFVQLLYTLVSCSCDSHSHPTFYAFTTVS